MPRDSGRDGLWLPREVIDWPVFRNPPAFSTWVYCCQQAARDDGEVPLRLSSRVESVPVHRGELATTTRRESRVLKRPRHAIIRDIQWLHEQRYITIRPQERYTLIMVRDFDRYCPPEAEASPP